MQLQVGINPWLADLKRLLNEKNCELRPNEFCSMIERVLEVDQGLLSYRKVVDTPFARVHLNNPCSIKQAYHITVIVSQQLANKYII